MNTTVIDPTKNKFKTKPYKHQLDCLRRFGHFTAFALLAEQGTGKSFIIIINAADLWAAGKCDTMLVFAPNGVHTNWTEIEIPKHMPDWVRYRAVAWHADASKTETKVLEAMLKPENAELRILTMNWEAMATKRGVAFATAFVKSGLSCMLVCDESDAIKNPSAKRTTALMNLKRHSAWRRIMSGTPSGGNPFDLFSQYSFLDERILGTTSFYAFKNEYAEMLQQGHPLLTNIMAKSGSRRVPQIVATGKDGRPKYRNLERLTKLIEPYSFRVLKKDCLDLPEKIYKTLVFDLTKEQREVYKKAKDEYRVMYEGQETAFTQLTILQKLAQITSGYYLHPASEEPVRIPGATPKLDMLIERVVHLTGAGEKIIIWARFRAEIADIAARLKEQKIKFVEYHGGVDAQSRPAVIEHFERGNAQVFLGNQQAGGMGITLVAASTVFYFSNDFDLRHRLQSEDRAHRIGQTKNVVYYNLVARNTIDERVVRALINKEEITEILLDF